MKNLCLLVLLSIAFASAASCNQHNCKDCTAEKECGWCAATQQCLNGTIDGPDEGNCLGPAWEFNSCADCTKMNDCRECLAHPSDCMWCSDTSTCKTLAFGGCQIAHTCPCTDYATCSTCLESSDCQWCQEDLECKDRNSKCAHGPGHNKTIGCPCEVNHDCDSCRDDYGCAWCTQKDSCMSIDDANRDCPIAHNNSCNAYCELKGTGCHTCNDLPGCAWCPKTHKCVDSRSTSCLISHTCCDHSFCDTCIGGGCKWCENSNLCLHKSSEEECFAAHSCESYCKEHTTCHSCTSKEVKGCGWCSATETCEDSLQSSCALAHTCSNDDGDNSEKKKCGFDGGAFVGGMFLIIGILAVAILGFIFYRWKTGQRILYTELK